MAGQLDPEYGNNGAAPIPATPPRNPDTETLQTLTQCVDANGVSAFCGYLADEPSDENPLFTRLLANGEWDEVTGHVPPEPTGDPNEPDGLFAFKTLNSVEIGSETNYLTVSAPVYFNYKKGTYLEYFAVGRFDEDFRAVPDFGYRGFAYPHPGAPWEILSNKMLRSQCSHYSSTRALLYWTRRPIALINNTIRVIYPQFISDIDDNESTSTWIALLSPQTGQLAAGLGNNRDKYQMPLTDAWGEPLELHRAVFLNDGGFLLLARTQDTRNVVLRRYFDNGLPDETFANGEGQVVLPSSYSKRYGMGVKNNRVIVSEGTQYDVDEPSTVYCYRLDGSIDETFNAGEALRLGSGLKLDHAQFDAQGRIVLAGTQYLPPPDSALNVVRLLPSGELDETFGEGGFYDGAPYYAAANDLFVTDNKIHVLSLFPVQGAAPFYEVMLKILD
ncbi:delta-60 repeat domain-containing protein [Pseudomonas sp. NUPR-001]|uniref:delta-60 repeat domain-containing protein n=1 Tax=Pseudomonas sp. NUPR-001 TaxID=3416058 RepID=UPI003F984655